MPLFHYEALTDNGEPVKGTLEAPDTESVIRHLQNQGYYPITTGLGDPQQLQGSLWNSVRKVLFMGRPLHSEQSGIRQRDLLAFTRNMATLLNAGLNLDQALGLLEGKLESAHANRILKTVHTDIQAGMALSSALSRQAASFNTFYTALIRSGEANGNLGQAFSQLNTHLEKAEKVRSAMINALVYPAILVVIALLSLFFLMTLVIPRFIPMFTESGQSLPWLSQTVFNLSAWVLDYWWLFPALLLLLAVSAKHLANRLVQNSGFLHFTLRLPVAGLLIRQIQSARFARASATLLQSGLPLLEAFKLAKYVISHPSFLQEISQAINGLESGKRLSALLQHSLILPALAVDLIKVGEESGQLPAMFKKIADIYENESEQQLKRLLVFLEPLLILGLGALIALVILSVLLAMLSLNTIVL